MEAPAFKPPPVLDPPLSSPPLSLRDPPWPHGGATPPPGRQSPGERGPPSTQKKDPVMGAGVGLGGPSHRVPRPYNKVASSKYGGGGEEDAPTVKRTGSGSYLCCSITWMSV